MTVGGCVNGQAATSSFICTPSAFISSRNARSTVPISRREQNTASCRLMQPVHRSSCRRCPTRWITRSDSTRCSSRSRAAWSSRLNHADELVDAWETRAEGVFQGTRVRAALAEHVAQQALLYGLAGQAGLGHEMLVKSASRGQCTVMANPLHRAKTPSIVNGYAARPVCSPLPPRYSSRPPRCRCPAAQSAPPAAPVGC